MGLRVIILLWEKMKTCPKKSVICLGVNWIGNDPVRTRGKKGARKRRDNAIICGAKGRDGIQGDLFILRLNYNDKTNSGEKEGTALLFLSHARFRSNFK